MRRARGDGGRPGRGRAEGSSALGRRAGGGLRGGIELVLARHAETTAYREGRYLGWGDAPLTAEGEAAARRLGARLLARLGPPALVFSSDLPRALRTAALALPGAAVLPDARLRELDFGDFEGRSRAENLARARERFRAWLGNPREQPPPGGERLDELEGRVAAWLAELRGLAPRGPAVAFLHGGSLAAALALVRHRPLEGLLPLLLPPCGTATLRLPRDVARVSRSAPPRGSAPAGPPTGSSA